MAPTAKKWTYDLHPGLAMTQSVLAGMKEKTGRSPDEWVALIKKQAPPSETQRRAWLKEEHGFGTNYAGWLAELSVGKGQEKDPEGYLKQASEYVEKMFAGPKEGLRPIYDELLKLGKTMGKDVRVCPCQTIVPLYRKHVFAQIKP